MRGVGFVVLFVLLGIGCSQQITQQADTQPADIPQSEKQLEVDTMKLTSPEFEHNKAIPSEFTCDANDISPPLQISDVPQEARSLVLIMDDPDAPMGTFVHWVMWNIPPETTEIKKGEQISWPQGRTDFGRIGYGGPCPPQGTHRYFFKLYVLDTTLDLPPGSTKQEVEDAMSGHKIAEAQLIGTYTR